MVRGEGFEPFVRPTYIIFTQRFYRPPAGTPLLIFDLYWAQKNPKPIKDSGLLILFVTLFYTTTALPASIRYDWY